jgi:hypothetical protein
MAFLSALFLHSVCLLSVALAEIQSLSPWCLVGLIESEVRKCTVLGDHTSE